MDYTPVLVRVWRGLSSDGKPDAAVGDFCCETDTDKVFTREVNGWTEVITAENFKSGNVVVTEDSSESVVFITTFTSVPSVAVSVEETSPEHYVSIGSITTSGFTIYLDKPGGGPAGSVTVHWIATDAGNV